MHKSRSLSSENASKSKVVVLKILRKCFRHGKQNFLLVKSMTRLMIQSEAETKFMAITAGTVYKNELLCVFREFDNIISNTDNKKIGE